MLYCVLVLSVHCRCHPTVPAGPCCRVGKEPCSNGIHQCGQSAQPHPGVLGGVEHGEPRGDSTLGHCKVSVGVALCVDSQGSIQWGGGYFLPNFYELQYLYSLPLLYISAQASPLLKLPTPYTKIIGRTLIVCVLYYKHRRSGSTLASTDLLIYPLLLAQIY